MTLAEISIRKPVFAWMLMAAFILLGGLCFQRLGISQMPDVDSPQLNISVNLSGAAPDVIEMNVVEPIEDAILSVQGIKNVSSSSRTGRANITVEFDLKKNIDIAVQEVQAILGQVQRRLPADTEAPVISKSNPEDAPILWLSVSSDQMPLRDLMAYVRERVRDQFSTLDGVSEIFLGGYVDPSLRVQVSAKRLEQLQLSVGDIAAAIKAEHVELPAGRIEGPEKELNLRVLGEATSIEEFNQLAINRRGGGVNFSRLTLKDVAQVDEGLADVRRISRSMGKPSIGIGIKKQRGANAVAVAHAAKERLKEVQKTLPEGMRLAVNFDSTKFIEEAVNELNFTLILAAVLTSLVCYLFLGSWSATLNVIMAIPVSVIGSFVALYAMGFTLNTFTLLGLSLAIGIVVDDAIMVLENIMRHREKGLTKEAAALSGAKEITFAAIAATAAVISIFLPVAFMEGIIGRYFYQFGVTISFAVGISLIEALTLTPMRCAAFLETHQRSSRLGRLVNETLGWCERSYHTALTWVLAHRWTTLGFSVAGFAASLLCVGAIKKEFIPSQDMGSLMVRLQAPVGSSLEYTDKQVREIESIITKTPAILSYFVSIGGFGGGEVDTATLFITMKDLKDRPQSSKTGKPTTQSQLSSELREEFKNVKGIRAIIMDQAQGAFGGGRGGYAIQFTVKGPEWNTLIESTKSLSKAIEQTKLVTDVDSNYRAGMPEIHIVPDRQKAQARGVSLQELNETISTLIGGSVVARYARGNYRYDVRLRLVEEERNTTESLSRLLIRNNRGELIPLKEIAEIEQGEGLQTIYHEGRERAITIYGNVAPGASQATVLQKIEEVAKATLPAGYHGEVGGSSSTFRESFQQLYFALLLGIVVAYMILAAQFNSFIHPFTVLLALPFSLSGAFVSLWLTGHSLNVFSMIGIVLLMGIVKKNSIILVDFANQLRDQGRSVSDALKEACPQRLRPILMTSISTIAGAVPPALAIGPGAETRIPMAIAVIGGVLVSTVLTLAVVPAAYSLFSREAPRDRSGADGVNRAAS